MEKELPEKKETGFEELLKLEKIELQHLEALSPQKQKEFRKVLTDMLTATHGEERDAFLLKIGAIIDPEKIWEFNQAKITEAIDEFVKRYAAIPSKVQIAAASGLSRETVYKHLRTFSDHFAKYQQNEMQMLMTQHVLSKVLQRALNGDTAAAKLYLKHFIKDDRPAKNDVVINNQNNYVQINSTVISQETIRQLNPEQLKKIEEIIVRGLEMKN